MESVNANGDVAMKVQAGSGAVNFALLIVTSIVFYLADKSDVAVWKVCVIYGILAANALVIVVSMATVFESKPEMLLTAINWVMAIASVFVLYYSSQLYGNSVQLNAAAGSKPSTSPTKIEKSGGDNSSQGEKTDETTGGTVEVEENTQQGGVSPSGQAPVNNVTTSGPQGPAPTTLAPVPSPTVTVAPQGSGNDAVEHKAMEEENERLKQQLEEEKSKMGGPLHELADLPLVLQENIETEKSYFNMLQGMDRCAKKIFDKLGREIKRIEKEPKEGPKLAASQMADEVKGMFANQNCTLGHFLKKTYACAYADSILKDAIDNLEKADKRQPIELERFIVTIPRFVATAKFATVAFPVLKTDAGRSGLRRLNEAMDDARQLLVILEGLIPYLKMEEGKERNFVRMTAETRFKILRIARNDVLSAKELLDNPEYSETIKECVKP